MQKGIISRTRLSLTWIATEVVRLIWMVEHTSDKWKDAGEGKLDHRSGVSSKAN